MENFFNPPSVCRGTDFFMLNGTLTDDELRRQISEMADKGVASFIARTYIGLRSDYPGPGFMHNMRTMIDEAKKHSMTVFVQAGYMPEAVLDLPEEYSLGFLCIHDDYAFPNDEKYICDHNGITYSFRSSKTFLDLFDREAIAFYIHQSYDLWQPFSEEFGKTISSVWVDEPSYCADYLPWPRIFEEKFFDRYGYDIKPHVYKLYHNDGDYKKIRYHYWTLLQKLLEECYFSMIRDWCNKNGLMFSGHLMREDTLFLQISRACATMPYYKYFDIPGIDILMGAMEWKNEPILSKDNYEQYRTDMYVTPLQAVSASHQAGKDHILCEMYGVTTNGMGFRDFIHHFDHFASFGINYRSVHGIFYSLHGRGKRMYPPHVNYYQPYWHKYSDVTDYCARVSAFLSQGKPYSKVLVLHPLETAYCLYKGDKKEPVCPRELEILDKKFNTLLRTLLSNHISFELGDLNTISSGCASVDGGIFKIGEMQYDTVVLPYLEVLNAKTAELLKDLTEKGGKVIVLGDYPFMLDGDEFDMKNSYLLSTSHCKDLSALIFLLARCDGTYNISSDKDDSSLRVYHTKNKDELYYMVFNGDCKDNRKVLLSVKGNYQAEAFDAANASLSPIVTSFDGVETSVNTKVSEGGSVLIRFKECELPKRSFSNDSNIKYTLELDNAFDLSRLSNNVLVLEYCDYKTDGMKSPEGPLTTLTVNRLLSDKEYEGELSQYFKFTLEKAIKDLSLALEDASACEVYLNGVQAESYDGESFYFAKDFNVIKLPSSSVCGENVIEIKRHFVPLSKAKSAITSLFECQVGVELENVFLLGNFGVYTHNMQSFNRLVKFPRDFILSDEKTKVNGLLTRSGYPFYSGTVKLSKSFILDGAPKYSKCELNISEFHGCVAEIYINGVYCGDAFKAPFCVDISKSVKEGKNDLEVYLTNTLRPILGPFHRPRGEVGECWGGGYGDPDSAWTGSSAGKDWYKNTETDSEVWTDTYNQPEFGISDISLIFSM